ncbi:MAG: YggS family pyridoxal phosphate-dependent enzyme [Verrucomicrobiae bacterium]|nr:YggS family pyridoxal phosphate-dependent enzyme [Verrucomicrobiae bacterium]
MSIAENLRATRERITAAAARAGRPGDAVTLVAVSKTFPAEAVREAFEAGGQTVFGENKVQEGIDKVPVLPDSLEWHLIGHLQSNKIRKALPLFGWIETVDSLKRAEQIDRVAGELALRPKILLQVNIGDDDAKFGYAPEQVRADLAPILALPHLDVRGLMTIPPIEESPEATRRHFAALRELRDQLAAETGAALPELSMGMSGDFEIAVEEGATLVRVGSSIFGARG